MIFSIRRTATIPLFTPKKENVLALLEVGGKVENKNWVYENFFLEGYAGVKEKVLEKIKEKGGDEEVFKNMFKIAEKKVKADLEREEKVINN